MTVPNILARLLTITVMIGCVLALMHLTGARHDAQNNGHVTNGVDAMQTATTKADRLKIMAASWNGSVNFDTPFAALAPLSDTQTEIIDRRFDPADDFWGLPRSDGVDTVAGLCGACHSLAIVMQQRQSEEGWNYLFDWMIEKQGMAPITGDTRSEIIAYLSREFGQE